MVTVAALFAAAERLVKIGNDPRVERKAFKAALFNLIELAKRDEPSVQDGMTDGELIARAILVFAHLAGEGHSPVGIDDLFDSELDRRAKARKAALDKPRTAE